MLRLFSAGVGEWPPIWERAVHSVYCACLSSTFINLCVCAFFPFDFEGGMWDLFVFIPVHCLPTFTLQNLAINVFSYILCS